MVFSARTLRRLLNAWILTNNDKMDNKEPNRIIKQINKRLQKLHTESGGMSNRYNWPEYEIIKKDFENIVRCVGAIEVMSKNTLILCVALQSKLRAMPEHSFYIQFIKAAEDLKLIEQ